jgi:hypothetical protein
VLFFAICVTSRLKGRLQAKLPRTQMADMAGEADVFREAASLVEEVGFRIARDE